jgi:peptide/nickel transport system permease protein
MANYLAKRFFHLIFILLGVSFISFLLISLTPGDFLTSLTLNPEIPAQTIENLRKDFGLDKPWYVQYFKWLYNLSPIGVDLHQKPAYRMVPIYLKFPDFGYSFSYKIKVTTLIWSRFLNTIMLSLCAEIIIWIFAIPL